MSDSDDADRRAEVAELRDKGYSPDEIRALLSDDKWAGYSSHGIDN